MPSEPIARRLRSAAVIAAPLLLVTLAHGGGCATGTELTAATGNQGPGGSSTGTSTSASSGSASSGGAGGRGGATSSSTASSSSNGGAGGGGPIGGTCPTGELLTGLDGQGNVVCAPLAGAAEAAISSACSVYLGWRDNCGGCTDPPAKWGVVSTATCLNGAGTNDTCTTPALGGQTVQLFGLNTDGDVNDDDKLFTGLYCAPGDHQSAAGPCKPGAFVTAVSGTEVTCSPASGPILDYVREGCSVYLGWRDSCDGCTTAPAKWGRASTMTCVNGTGTGNTCTAPILGGTNVQLFGLNTGGDVDDNDKLYVGLRCVEPLPAGDTVTGACPPGQLANGVGPGGALSCVSPAPLVAAWFREHCSLYFGWRDACDACADPPAKWGRVRDGFCENGVGLNGTCSTALLGTEMVTLYGLNTDGDVGEDDKLHIAFRCF